MSILAFSDDYLLSTAFQVRIGGAPVDFLMEAST
jgi:hypothetical protein